MAMAIERPRSSYRWLLWLVGAVVVIGLLSLMVEDWHQLWKISSAPDNIPIVANDSARRLLHMARLQAVAR